MTFAERSPPSNERRRLLFLLAFPPRLDGTHGGARATANLMAALSSRHDVAALYLRGNDEPPIDPALRARCTVVEEVARDPSPGLWSNLRHNARVVGARAHGVPWWPATWGAGNFAERARRLACEWQPDVVHLEFFAMGQFAAALADCPALRVLTPHEPYSTAVAERSAYRAMGRSGVKRSDPRHRLYAAIEMRLWRRYERNVMQQADVVVAFTERDRRALAVLAGATPVVQIPLGAPVPERALDSVGVDPPEVLFVGNFKHPPNRDAALHLVRTIAPLLWERVANARLVIVGPMPTEALRAQAGDRVIITGEVADVTPYLNRAAVMAAPVRLGGGMRVKVLEALAAGKAVVASPRAIEGLDVTSGDQVLVAEDDAAFAAGLADLIQSPARRAALGARARAWACNTFSDERWAEAYDELYRNFQKPRTTSVCATAIDEEGLVRAADWRFLLPRPASGSYERLIVLGGSSALLERFPSMGFAADVTDVLPHDRSASAIVVLPGAAVAPRLLADALASGGSLYVEVDRRSLANWRWTPAHLSHALSEVGISTTGLYAVGRRGLAPRRYVSLDDPGPALWFLHSAYRPVTAAQLLAREAATRVLKARMHRSLLHPILPTYAITAVAGSGSSVPLVLDSILPNSDSSLNDARLILFGDGGDRVVALPFPPEAPHPSTVLKVPRSPAFRGRTENEQMRMRELRDALSTELARAIPEPRGIISRGEVYTSAEQVMPGRTLLTSSGSLLARAERRIADLRLAAEWLTNFHRATAVGQHHSGNSGGRDVGEWVDALFGQYVTVYGEGAAERRLRAAARSYAATLAEAQIPVVLQHRDFAVWNLAADGDTLSVLDWEGARPGPPLCDLLHLVTSWDMAIRRPASAHEEMRNFRALFLDAPGRDAYRVAAHDAITRYVARLELDERLVPMLLLHYCLELAIRRADQIGDRGGTMQNPRTGNQWVAAITLLAHEIDTLFKASR